MTEASASENKKRWMISLFRRQSVRRSFILTVLLIERPGTMCEGIREGLPDSHHQRVWQEKENAQQAACQQALRQKHAETHNFTSGPGEIGLQPKYPSGAITRMETNCKQ